MTDTQARDTYTESELALDENGKFLALRMKHLCGQGAYVTPAGIGINTNNVARCLPGMYRIPKIDFSSRCVFTNTAPIGPYRGAGRPEANYALDRVVEEAARVTGIDTVQLRRKNLIPPSAMPYKTAVTTTYDSGDFPAIFAKAMEMSDYKNFNKRKRESAKRKKLRGIGISCMLEHAGALPTESASLVFPGGDKLILALNVQSTGQSHATVFGRLLSDQLGIDRKTIEHQHGDSSREIVGFASVGSRSAMAAGHAIVHTTEVMLAKGKKIASGLLEASESDIQYKNGNFEVVGTDRRISLFETARRAKEMSESLDTKEKAETPLTFPERRAHRRSRDRSRHRQGRRGDLHRGRRLRQHAQPHDRRGPGARQLGQRFRPGAPGERRLRPERRAAAHRLVHGLRHAARTRHAGGIARGGTVHSGHHQSIGRQGHRRGRHHRRDRCADERDRTRGAERRRRSHGHAGDAREGVGSVSEGDGEIIAVMAGLVPAIHALPGSKK